MIEAVVPGISCWISRAKKGKKIFSFRLDCNTTLSGYVLDVLKGMSAFYEQLAGCKVIELIFFISETTLAIVHYSVELLIGRYFPSSLKIPFQQKC